MFKKNEVGVLVATDRSQEWLLPWWWSNYRARNRFPVTFVDFGMTLEAQKWCSSKGDLIAIDSSFPSIALKEHVPSELRAKWEAIYGQTIWQARLNWFKKPWAMARFPYNYTLWLDIDCEVLGPLDPLFAACAKKPSLYLAVETCPSYESEVANELISPDATLYNSGVVVYPKNSFLISEWSRIATLENHRFWNDQSLLSHLIFSTKEPVCRLDPIYNWRISQGVNIEAVIIHWVGHWGKNYIKTFGGLRPELEKLGLTEGIAKL
ncbi:MAG: hypothetical protein ACM3JI_06060 [Anaerolineae bacterium]